MEKKRYTLAVLVDNSVGVLSQVSRLFSRKGYNIESLAVGTIENPNISRITIEVLADDDDHVTLLCNQLGKLLPVHSVKLLQTNHAIRRELVLIKVRAATSEDRNEVIQISSVFRASIIDVAPESITVAIIGQEDKTEAICRLLEKQGILEMVRTGVIALERGISLRSYEDTGVATDALFTRELVRSIFTPPLPLHDGGVVLRDGFLSSAHCIFPVSNNPELIASGMRHRAAVGLSEETDALVVVVSEERGTISVAHNGHLYSYERESAREPVLRWLTKAMPQGPEHRGFIPSVLVPIQQFFMRQRRTGS